MNILTEKAVKRLFFAVCAVGGGFLLLMQLVIWSCYRAAAPVLIMLGLLALAGVLYPLFLYFKGRNKILEAAAERISSYLLGNKSARIECDKEGGLYKLFHLVNTLAAVLNAHAENELRAKEFLKSAIADISHQLKTPLAALSIYNGLLQSESERLPEIREFAELSEKELDRMETLVQSLLKIIKLDSGSIVIKKTCENIADMMSEIELHFAYRARLEQKEINLFGPSGATLFCDHDWMLEAVSNIVKNALDHMKPHGQVFIEWKQLAALTQLTLKDDGDGIHPEDIHHIFKRFYRSRFSQDKQGLGLGLSLAKVVVEAHGGAITADSLLGRGSTFTISFLNPTKP